MKFSEAFDVILKDGKRVLNPAGCEQSYMRLPQWQDDVKIKIMWPSETSEMTAPYLYVESRYGRVPWKETMIELFSNDWEVTLLS